MTKKAPGKAYREGLTLVQLMDMFPTEETALNYSRRARTKLVLAITPTPASPGHPFCYSTGDDTEIVIAGPSSLLGDPPVLGPRLLSHERAR